MKRVGLLRSEVLLIGEENFNAGAGRELPAGSYAVMPAGARHFAWAKGETVIQV